MEERLTLAVLHIQKAQERVWAQEKRIWTLRRLGIDTTEHKLTLDAFRETLALFEQHYGVVLDRMQRLRRADMLTPLAPTDAGIEPTSL